MHSQSIESRRLCPTGSYMLFIIIFLARQSCARHAVRGRVGVGTNDMASNIE